MNTDGMANTVRLGSEDGRIHALVLGYWYTIVTPTMVLARHMVQAIGETRANGIVTPVVASLAGNVEVEEAAQYPTSTASRPVRARPGFRSRCSGPGTSGRAPPACCNVAVASDRRPRWADRRSRASGFDA